ncbi:hypothetical protein [Haloarcula amylovorans]|uniref:hypothetical protein n=1 Tax=Haloarcula amylovorans TaxID=2562280 RepID=UPI001431B9F0|nr:hypothetical protein [Halomicroarcula amylolytica]
MVSEYDLPCSECGDSLVRAEVTTADGSTLTVAECRSCGGRYYPESTLQQI